MALLAYLVVTGRPQRRDRLADLLWPDYDQEHARATLRRTLSALNAAVAGDWLVATRETVGLNPDAPIWSDVAAFRERLAACGPGPRQAGQPRDSEECLLRLAEAVELYTDHFMAGFALRDSPDFDDWQFVQREALQRELAGALERLVAGRAAAGDHDGAIAPARPRLAQPHRDVRRLHRLLHGRHELPGERRQVHLAAQGVAGARQRLGGVVLAAEEAAIYGALQAATQGLEKSAAMSSVERTMAAGGSECWPVTRVAMACSSATQPK